jgi:hypothetical protein
MSKQKMTAIDPEKLRTFVEEKGVFEVTKMIGKAPNYFHNVCKRRSMPYGVLQAMCAIYSKKPEDFKPAAPDLTINTGTITSETQQAIREVIGDVNFVGQRSNQTVPIPAPVPVPSPMPSIGYALDLRVYPAFVSLALYEDSKMLKFAKAKIKNGEKASQLDVVQAISYAAHMLYKFMEQDAIE